MSGAARPGSFAVIAVSISALAAGTFSIVAIGTLAPKLQAHFDLSRAEIGLLTSLVFFGSMLTSRRAGKLTDSRTPALVLGISLAFFSASMLFAALAPNGMLFMVAALLAGIAYGGVNPPTNVVVAGSLFKRLGFFLSVKQSGVPLGGLLAGVVLPPVAIAFGWRAGFVLAAALCAVVAAITPLLRNASVLAIGAGADQPGLSRGQSVAMGAFGFVMSGTQWAFLTYLVLYLTEQFHFGLALAGLALALAQGLGAGARLLWGWLSDATGRRLTVLLTMAGAQFVVLELLAGNPSRATTWPLVGLAGFTIVGWNGAYYALLAERAGPARVGRASGTMLVFIFAGSVAVPPLLGVVVDSLNSWRPLWAICGGAVALGAGVLWLGLRGIAPAGGLVTRSEATP